MTLFKTILLTSFFSLSTFAIAPLEYDYILKSQNNFSLKSANAESKLDRVLMDEEAVLNNYAPASVTVIEKKITGKDFYVVVERTFFGKFYRFVLIGTLEFTKGAHQCKANETAYRAFFDFSKSGPEIADDVAAFSIDMCAKTSSQDTINVTSSNKLYYREKKYSVLIEPVAKSVLNDQVNAFFSAIKQTIIQQ